MSVIQDRRRNTLEDLFYWIGDLREVANKPGRSQLLALLDTIADEVYKAAERIKTSGGIRDYAALNLVTVVANALATPNRPKIYDDDVLFYLYYALQDASLGKLRPIALFSAINNLERQGIKAHYSGCECPVYLLKIP
ncbi:hypothetical protein HYX05_05340 [Candidatus Woesearchaeota archaeon]|nr:hypothetical protein [Candidatus Woesearchaeota archaeon]